mgnify:FL=1
MHSNWRDVDVSIVFFLFNSANYKEVHHQEVSSSYCIIIQQN